MIKRKIGLTIVTAALIALAAVGSTFAWFTSSAEVENRLAMGYVDIEVEEPEYEESLYQQLTPGDTIMKDPTILLADGSQPAYIRVKLPKVITTDGSEFPLFGQEVSFQAELQDGWIQKGDYIYYNKPLGGENPEKVQLLKTNTIGSERYTMSIPGAWGNDFTNQKLTLTFEAEAIQVIKNMTFNFQSDNPWPITSADEIVKYKSS